MLYSLNNIQQFLQFTNYNAYFTDKQNRKITCKNRNEKQKLKSPKTGKVFTAKQQQQFGLLAKPTQKGINKWPVKP